MPAWLNPRISPKVTELLYGTSVPIVRNVRKLGEECFNGDVVPLGSDYLTPCGSYIPDEDE